MSDTETKVKIKVDVEMDDAVKEFERLQKAQAQAAAQTKLVGDKFSELGKSMVGLQMHDAFNKISKAAGEATGGVLDLNGAFAGYQVAGVWGAAIGGLSGVLSKLGDSLGLSAGLLDMTNQALSDYEKGIIKASNPVRQFLDDQHKLANQYRVELFDAFKVGVKAANEYEESIKGVLTVSKKLISDIERISAAALGPNKLDRQIEELKAAMKEKNRGLIDRASSAIPGLIEQFASRGVGVDQWSGPIKFKGKGEESEAARAKRLRGLLGSTGTDSGDIGSFGAASSIFGTGGQGKASENLDEFGRQRDALANFNNELEKTAHWKAELVSNRASEKSALDSMFGTRTEIDAKREAWSMLTGSMTAGYNALVDGTMSASAAMKHFLADSIKAIGAKMLVRSAEEVAEGISALASYNYPKAANNFLAAGKFAAGAAFAGVVASSLGGGGGGGGGGGAGAGAGAGGGGGSSSGNGSDDAAAIRSAAAANDASALAKLGVYTKIGNQDQGYQAPIVIIQTNPFRTGDTPRMKRNEVDQFTAMGSGGRTAVR